MVDDIIQGIRIFITCILSTQFAFGCTIFLFESAMINYYAMGTYEKPSTPYQKFVNFFMFTLMGTGFHIYLNLRKYNWFVRKLLFLIALLLQGIASVIIYKIIYGTLKAIFL